MIINKVAIIGAGYVGTSIGVLLSQKYKVSLVDVDENKIRKINNKESPIADHLITEYLSNKQLDLKGFTKLEDVLNKNDLYILALPTNYDPERNFFDTSILEGVIKDISLKDPSSTILIRSTVPVGFTERMKKESGMGNIIFSPEFLREGYALQDNLYPSRLVFGEKSKTAEHLSSIFEDLSLNNPKSLLMDSKEAESVKLFSNSYLALRISYFNELDSYCLNLGLDTKEVISAVCADPRIGEGYNNPSFGYGGYCLPKDTKQLLANYSEVPQNIISAIVAANTSRKDFIADNILQMNSGTLGLYRLIMKNGSDNIRESSMQGIMKRLKAKGVNIVIYEPLIEENKFYGSEVIGDLKVFLERSSLILTNRMHEDLNSVKEKVYTRDLFNEN